ncbi:hypothetical protein [Methylicorpusculum sp.]|uniref:hypothetical protein n=1 Tax=Methylicorpusculum sp. TaxID=2713644 RepID=UPI00271AA3EB|nr:hypothetical protein [Methylicorpusculum sp.]MDO8844444.1 hypothetical protein [Methylicorpusculum sp.]
MTIHKNLTGSSSTYDALPGLEICTSLSKTALKQAILDHLIYSIGRVIDVAPKQSYYKALALSVRDRLQHRWINTVQRYLANGHADNDLIKVACYFRAIREYCDEIWKVRPVAVGLPAVKD